MSPANFVLFDQAMNFANDLTNNEGKASRNVIFSWHQKVWARACVRARACVGARVNNPSKHAFSLGFNGFVQYPRVSEVADYEIEFRIQKLEMAGPIWRTKMKKVTKLG